MDGSGIAKVREGGNISRSTVSNIATWAPMASPRVATTVATRPGDRRSRRAA